MHRRKEFEEGFRNAERVFNHKNTTSNILDIAAAAIAGISVAVSNAAQAISIDTLDTAFSTLPDQGFIEWIRWGLVNLSTPALFGGALSTLILSLLTFVRFDSRHLSYSLPYIASRLLFRFVIALSTIVFLGHFAYFSAHFYALNPEGLGFEMDRLSESMTLFVINNSIALVAAITILFMERLILQCYGKVKDLHEEVHKAYERYKYASVVIAGLVFVITAAPLLLELKEVAPAFNCFSFAALFASLFFFGKQRKAIIDIHRSRNRELGFL